EPSENFYDFDSPPGSSFNSQFDNLPSGQNLELDLEKEPCYIAKQTGVVTWCDTKPGNQPTNCGPTPCPNGFLRAVPWDEYLQSRRTSFIQALKQDLQG